MRNSLIILAGISCFFSFHSEAADQRFLVIVVDGLRPDYITPEVMPNLHRLGEDGVFFENHHAVYPTVTRVNSSSISTGSYPTTHGLLGNSVYFANVEAGKGLSTSDYENLQRIEAAEEGKLLTATTLGEVLGANGESILALSSGSTGSAMLLNHTLAGLGVINVGAILPDENRELVESAIGPAPEDRIPARARNAWVVDAYIAFALERNQPAVTLIWLTDPDHTAHPEGMGSELTIKALENVDRDIRRIRREHFERGLEGTINILVTSDHGFSTQIGGFNPVGLLIKHNLRPRVVMVGGAMYVENRDAGIIERIVKLLQAEDWAGAIFTKAVEPGSKTGWVEGTLSFDAVHWQHDRSADILVSPNWDDGENEYGIKGRTTFPGVAGHGSTSPWDIHNTLIACGPAFKRGLRSEVATSNVDIAPTILNLMHIRAPETMTGRLIREAMADGPDPGSVESETSVHSVATDAYQLELIETVVDGHRYVDFTRVTR